MTDYMGELTAAVRAWVDSQDRGTAGVRMVDVQLRDPHGEYGPVEVQLPEVIVDQLRYVLEVDTAARVDGDPVAHHRDLVEPGDEVRFAAARLEQLTNPLGFTHDAKLAWPETAASVLTEIARASAALSQLAELGTKQILAGVRGGSLVALPRGAEGPREVPNQTVVADAQARLVASVTSLLRQAGSTASVLAEQVAGLSVTSVALGGGDGETLDAETVLLLRLPGMVNEGRFHIRVFRPRDRDPVVVIGQLADNDANSVTNLAEELAATVAEIMVGGAAHDAVSWVLVYPDGMYGGTGAGEIETVTFDRPFSGPGWGFLTQQQLDELAGGPVKRYHASEYTVARLHAAGIAALSPPPRRRRP